MATPTKKAMIEELTRLRVEVPSDATGPQLQALLKTVKALPVSPLEGRQKAVRASLPSSTAPVLRPPRPLVSTSTGAGENRSAFTTHVPPVSASRVVNLSRTVTAPAVPPPVVMSDHDARPWDPLAGW